MIPNDFHFERPAWLLALVPVAILVWSAFRSGTLASGWRRAVDAHLLRHLMIPGESGAQRWPHALLATGLVAATLAMAGPSWERVPQPTTKTIEPTVVALDMSLSMDVDDVTPSRLARARYEIQDVLARNAGGQIGLVVYTDEPFVAAPLTDDGRVLSEILPTLTSDLMPGRGSRLDRAIEQSAALLEQAGVPGGRILVLADSAGEDPEAARAAASAAVAAGRRVSVLGVGTEAGAPMRDPRGGLARDASGKTITATLPRAELEAVATAGQGRFALVRADGADIDALLAEPISLGSESDASGTASVDGADVEIWKDAGVYLLFLPLLLAPFAFRRGWLLVLTFAVLAATPRDSDASTWDDLWRTRDQQGAEALQAGDATAAAELFEKPDWRAAAHYEGGQYEQAIEAYGALEGTENTYNLGNSLARAGRYEDALKAYDETLAKAPNDEDARFNRDLVAKLLEQQKQQQNQQRQQNQNQQDQGGGQDQQQQQQQSQGSQGQEQKSDGEDSQQASAQDSQSAEPNEKNESDQDEKQPQNAGAEPQSAQPEEQQQSVSAGNEPKNDEPKQDQKAAADTTGDPNEKKNGAEEPDPAKAAQARQSPETKPEDDLQQQVEQALQEPAKEPSEEKPHGTALASADQRPMTEEEQAHEQRLRQVPDDPAGLLRAKIHRKYAEKRYGARLSQGGMDPWW
ncbi:MAG: VWA domain-containing protein [Deltaproteobacteria bacterium]|nr:VWA domain-containing protein [Deltaproteobacteria bacterium]